MNDHDYIINKYDVTINGWTKRFESTSRAMAVVAACTDLFPGCTIDDWTNSDGSDTFYPAVSTPLGLLRPSVEVSGAI